MGSVSSSGVFTPLGAGNATITATSTQDSTKSGNVTVTVVAPLAITSVTVGCAPLSILTTQTSTCSATVQGTGAYSSAVTWAATDGTINSSGVFTPAASGTATITATSTQDTTKSGSTSIAVAAPTALTITISDLPIGVLANVTVTGPNGGVATLASSQTISAIPGTYTLVAAPVVVGTNTYTATQITQAVTVTAGATSAAVVDYYDIIPNTTKVLDQAGQESLAVSSDGSTVTISSTSGIAQSLQVGNVLASAPTASAPNGLLVNILSVSNNGSTVVATVSQATLEGAIQQGSLSFTQTFIPASSQNAGNLLRRSKVLTEQEAQKAGIQYATNALSDSCSSDSNTFIVPFSYTIGAQGGISSGDVGDDASGQVWLDGTLEFCPQLQVNVQWGFLSLQSASVVASFGEHAMMTVKGQLSATLQVEHDFDQPDDPKILTEPTVVFVGEVPVVVQGQAFPYIGANLGAQASFYASAEQDAQAQAGLNYANGDTTPIQSATNATAIDGTSLDGALSGKLYVGMKVGVLVYGTLFPNIATDVYVGGTSGPPEALSWGLESNVGVTASIIGTNVSISLDSPELNLFNQTIWEESGSIDPSLGSVIPNAADAGSPDVSIALAGSNFVPDSVVNFNGIPLLTTFSAPSNISAVVPAGDLLVPGSYPITVTSPDTVGAVSSAIAFIVNGSTSNPIPSITSLFPNSLAVGATPQNVTINGTGFLSSSTVTLNGISHAATYMSANQLTISLTSADLATAGTYSVVVTNPAPGGGASSPVNFVVTSSSSENSEWTWISGANTFGQTGVYGTQGVPSTANVPGARFSAASWIDGSGNLWLFGGKGFYTTSGGNFGGNFNDLWEFNPNSETWTWISGTTNAVDQPGVYGTEGTPAPTNVPGSRFSAVSWIDGNGNLWLFGGGVGVAPTSDFDLNDLWEFNPNSKTWTWISGPDTENQPGVYGTQGTPATTNVPGAREDAVSWIDGSGNLWLFGGGVANGYEISALLNDLWEFNPSSKTWTWISGANTGNQPGVYGTQGTPATTNVPGAREDAVSWIDGSGNLWLFGGGGTSGTLNDLWEFNPNSETWTWISGTNAVDQPGVYGAQGVPAAANVPGARIYAVSWIDSGGNLWLFGGTGYDSNGNAGPLNDLWEFNPNSETWTWISGTNAVDQPGVYGAQGVPAAANVPGARSAAVSWIDSGGDLWLFGGTGYDSNGIGGPLNDLWSYQP